LNSGDNLSDHLGDKSSQKTPAKTLPETAKTFLVGGAVRDQLLKRPIIERDWLVVGGSTKSMLNAGYQQVGKDFPVFLHPKTKEEYALARQERKSGVGHTEFTTHTDRVTLEEDLLRRDFTINAIAQSETGDLISPYGGLEDIQSRTIRHVSEAFSEDPLRVLRAARFMAQLSPFKFKIAPQTLQIMQSMSVDGELNALTPERVWRETEKALCSPNPRSYFETLHQIGALNVILPEVDNLFGIPQNPKFHPEIDTGLHTMLSLDRVCELSKDPVLRFAVLIHDLGKGTTAKELLPSHKGHEQRSADLTRELCLRLKIPNRFKKLATLVAAHHLLCHRALRLPPLELETLLNKLGAWKEESLVYSFSLCCMADARGRTGLESRPYPQIEFLQECVAATKHIDVATLQKQGYSGKVLGHQIKRQRAAQLKTVIEKYSNINELDYAIGIKKSDKVKN